MTYATILTLLVLSGTGTSVTHTKYDTPSACETAGVINVAKFSTGRTTVEYTCTPTWEKPQ